RREAGEEGTPAIAEEDEQGDNGGEPAASRGRGGSGKVTRHGRWPRVPPGPTHCPPPARGAGGGAGGTLGATGRRRARLVGAGRPNRRNSAVSQRRSAGDEGSGKLRVMDGCSGCRRVRSTAHLAPVGRG